MIRSYLRLLPLLVTYALYGQQNIPFTIRVSQGATSGIVSNGTTVGVSSDGIGRPATITVSFQYRGTATASVAGLDISGNSQFTFGKKPSLPATLSPNAETVFEVIYNPTTSSVATGQLAITWAEAATPPVSGVVLINLNGSTPEFGAAYLLQNDQNVINVNDNGIIAFPPTPVGTVTTATVILLNRGSAPLDILTLGFNTSGTDLQLTGTPLLPGSLAAGGTTRFTVRYAPRQSGAHSGIIQIGLNGRTFTLNVTGSSTGPSFSYQLLTDSLTSTLLPNIAVNLPDTDLGVAQNFVIRVRNDGDGDGVINGIAVVGTGYVLSDLPFLPLTLAPGGAAFFTLTFAPTQPGRSVGRLRIGNDTFEFSANALGSRLQFSYGIGGVSIPLTPGGTVLFNPLNVGETSQLDFTVTNTGTTNAVFVSIATLSSGEFTIKGLSASAVTIRPDGKFTFQISFSPVVPGTITSVLRMDALAFSLSGTGRAPAALPTYRFTGATGQQEPLQQVSAGLALASPYPADLVGVLNLGFVSDSFAIDPALQFVTGGRSIAFTIPANTTSAIFPNNASAVRLQTGSVAGTIVLSPSFTLTGGLNVTPSNPLPLTLNVPARAPVVTALEVVSGATPNTLNLLVTGYATMRNLKTLELQFTAKTGASLTNGQIALDLASLAGTWFRGSTSQGFGGLFTINIPITLQGVPTSTTPVPISTFLQSATAVLINDQGRSNTGNVTVQ